MRNYDQTEKQPLIDAVIKSIKYDMTQFGDETVLDELLGMLSAKRLQGALDEEQWPAFQSIVDNDGFNHLQNIKDELEEMDVLMPSSCTWQLDDVDMAIANYCNNHSIEVPELSKETKLGILEESLDNDAIIEFINDAIYLNVCDYLEDEQN